MVTEPYPAQTLLETADGEAPEADLELGPSPRAAQPPVALVSGLYESRRHLTWGDAR